MVNDEDKLEFWDREFTDKPASSVNPTRDHVVIKTFDDVITYQEKLWEEKDKNLFYQYKKGMMYAQKCSHKQTDIDKVLETYIDAIIHFCEQNNIDVE